MYTTPEWLWAWPLLLWVGMSRLWLLTWRGNLDDDPIMYAVTDHPSLLCGSLLVIAFALALFA
jgi:hypothetical protein